MDNRQRIVNALFQPVDIASLVFFRVVVGLAMMGIAYKHASEGLVFRYFVEPEFHSTFDGFSWVRPLSLAGMNLVFVAIALSGLCVALGFLYRASAIVFAICFVYVFLIDKIRFQNHYYLMCLIGAWLPVLPLHRACSVDCRLRPRIKAQTVPYWMLLVVRFHVGLPYVFGGVAKIQYDWLHGQPMRMWLETGPLRYLLGDFVWQQPWFAVFMSWGGLLLDLLVVPALMWRRTRAAAFLLAAAFHLTNATIFQIGVFPWLMMAGTLVFFSADWPRRLLANQFPNRDFFYEVPTRSRLTMGSREKVVATLLAAYVALQVILPFRHHFYPGNPCWTEEGSYFSWMMMLHTKESTGQFVIHDPVSGLITTSNPDKWLTDSQLPVVGIDPAMIHEYALFLAEKYREQGHVNVAVHAVMLCSLNGRRPQQLIDPDVDLASQPRTLRHQSWIVPLREPFRDQPWSTPASHWPHVIEYRVPSFISPDQLSNTSPEFARERP